MAQYVDGYIIPMKKSKVKSYKKLAMWGRRVWMKHGALSYYECVADDYVEHGMGFKKMCKLKPDETVVFAYIVYKSKAHRKQVMKKVTEEMSKAGPMPDMPFDMKRFATAGFSALVRS